MTRYEIEEAAEYPFFATLLPFEGKKFRGTVTRDSMVTAATVIPVFGLNFGLNVKEETIH